MVVYFSLLPLPQPRQAQTCSRLSNRPKRNHEGQVMKDFQWTDIALFADMAEEGLNKIKQIFSLVKMQAGEKVIQEGETGDEMYILVKGRVRITKSMILKGMSLPFSDLQDTRKVLATLDGDLCPLFGEMALLDRDIRSATVETRSAMADLVAANVEAVLEGREPPTPVVSVRRVAVAPGL